TKIGPVHVMPGEEHTECITMNLKNAEGAFIRRFQAKLLEGSHHMILYRSKETKENLTPTKCAGFSGVLQGEAPLFIAQQGKTELELPKDESGTPVGLEIAANQMVSVEMHFLDATTAPIDVEGEITIDTIPLSAKVTKSDLVLFGTTDIKVPANGEYDTGVK